MICERPLLATYDVREMRTEIRHMDDPDPEHALLIEDTMARHDGFEPWVTRWHEAVHQYEADPDAWLREVLSMTCETGLTQ